MSVKLIITGGPEFLSLPWTTGMTGRDVLEVAYNSLLSSPPVTSFTYNLEYYGAASTDPLGYLVSMINGTFDSFNAAQAPYFFWEFLVNAEEQETGIDYTEIEDDDEVTFSYVQYVPEVHKGTALEAKYKRRLAFAK